MRKFLYKVFKQKDIGNSWGMIKQLLSQVTIYIAGVNLILIMITAYNTTISDWFKIRGMLFPFWTFAAIVAVFIIMAMAFEYKISLPSFWSFWNDQFYKHNNLLRRDIEEIKTQLESIEKKLSSKE